MEIGSGYEMTSGIDYLIFSVPSNAVPENAAAIVPYIDPGTVIVNVAKGFAPNSQKRLSEVIRELIPGHPVLTLSGPSHAEEVALNLPTTVVIAGDDAALLQEAQDVFMKDSFRVYQNTDQIGVEVGGAVKNIIALGAGTVSYTHLYDVLYQLDHGFSWRWRYHYRLYPNDVHYLPFPKVLSAATK